MIVNMSRICQLLLALVATSSALAVAAGGHRHAHAHQRRKGALEKKQEPGVYVDVVTVCDLNGAIISQAECDAGIAAGKLIFAHSPVLTVLPSSSVHVAPAPSSSSLAVTSAKPTTYVTSVTSKAAHPTPSSAPPTSTPKAASPSAAPSSPPTHSDSGVDTPFPSNIPCSEFPGDYGAMAIDYMGLGGWIGIQKANAISASGFDDIETMVSDLCTGSNCCTEGAFCSYACPAGYQKAQWPKTQGATGQSVGGIQCKNGHLTLTNPDYKTLCMSGTDKVTVKVQNKLNGTSAICRTDYPGTEAMTIPIDTKPGDVVRVTCPDESDYYSWEGKSTSGQYYVNPLDVPVEDACIWSNGDTAVGNWAPLNLGVGYSNGMAWLAIFQNKPTTYEKLDFSVEIVADNMSGKCKYSNGQYCSGDNYDDCNSDDGCTVAVSSGEATFVFSNE